MNLHRPYEAFEGNRHTQNGRQGMGGFQGQMPGAGTVPSLQQGSQSSVSQHEAGPQYPFPPPMPVQGSQSPMTDREYMMQMLARLTMLVEQNNQLLRSFLQNQDIEKQRQVVTSGGGSVIVRM
ncbi:hypothetical protein EV207_1532 [Scopulibacillus darangshiensis]|uniref:Uncharacterized protein n=1 Tax=Scopulibacillus darangshiensis TaxID=442528 RepID=A0A4R2NGK2_9BACL|nr:hypothetical protein [Scopulibacillus darangshiensis]TCP20285.1 hypothetical protein EV207_1532 [Scopulibacillus darangshiensis]